MALEPSILLSVKKNVGLGADYDVFDMDILTFINGAFFSLKQLGLGPDSNFIVEDEGVKWEDFSQDEDEVSAVKTYVYLKVRLLFDPPSVAYVQKSFEDQIGELEWRLSVNREGTKWADPTRRVVTPDE